MLLWIIIGVGWCDRLLSKCLSRTVWFLFGRKSHRKQTDQFLIILLIGKTNFNSENRLLFGRYSLHIIDCESLPSLARPLNQPHTGWIFCFMNERRIPVQPTRNRVDISYSEVSQLVVVVSPLSCGISFFNLAVVPSLSWLECPFRLEALPFGFALKPNTM